MLGSCASPPPREARVYTAPAPSAEKPYCAWFGDARGDVLYFGMSSFWWALHQSGGDPRADLEIAGPEAIGRFDLAAQRFLPSLPVGGPEDRTGVWDVLARPDGRVFFTDFFGSAGWVEAASGRVVRLPAAGAGLNELAAGPDGGVLVTRYGGAGGAVLWLDADGGLLRELPLAAEAGVDVAAKSVAFDPVRREIWVNTDLIPRTGGAPTHDVRVLGLDGAERLRFDQPEVQFMSFGPDGTGYFAERDGPRLRLRVRPPELASSALLTGRIIALDDAFPADLDFVQEVRAEPDGRVVVTRWSGRIHLVSPRGDVVDVDLPRDPGGLYYSGVLRDGAVCVTLCDRVRVVCAGVPGD